MSLPYLVHLSKEVVKIKESLCDQCKAKIANEDSSDKQMQSVLADARPLILNGKIKDTGVHIPVKPTIYEPALDELEKLGIVCKEKSQPL